jgi:hypothetical protein
VPLTQPSLIFHHKSGFDKESLGPSKEGEVSWADLKASSLDFRCIQDLADSRSCDEFLDGSSLATAFVKQLSDKIVEFMENMVTKYRQSDEPTYDFC